ncbi:MAG: hypothetical protein ACREOB_09865 [Thermodesulfobacteriota bacterium]
MRVWLELHKRKEKEKEDKRDKVGKPFCGKVSSSDKKSAGIIAFQVRGRGKKPFLISETSNPKERFS